MDFTFELATTADDPALRQLMATNPIPGQISLTYEREPDYFMGCGTMGRFCQVIVVRHQPTGQIVGLCCRASRLLFINGQIEDVGYLSQLRVAEAFQGRWLVSQGFHYLRQLHGDGETSLLIRRRVEPVDDLDSGKDLSAGVQGDVHHPKTVDLTDQQTRAQRRRLWLVEASGNGQ